VGLGYIKLGQSATTLSGGEAQRVKISSELYRAHLQKTIYLLDEPTVGLHYEDVKKLIEILTKLVDKGNTVVVIEHNLDLIKNADYVIDIGPEGGERGGKIVAKGTPEDVAKSEASYTGKYLKKVLRG
jgi:excinuclease ABC subunit A